MEHVVPVRVLVDQMIMNPTGCPERLEMAVVVAHITTKEHRKPGDIFTRHPMLCRRMLEAPVSELPHLGRSGRRGTSIRLQPTS